MTHPGSHAGYAGQQPPRRVAMPTGLIRRTIVDGEILVDRLEDATLHRRYLPAPWLVRNPQYTAHVNTMYESHYPGRTHTLSLRRRHHCPRLAPCPSGHLLRWRDLILAVIGLHHNANTFLLAVDRRCTREALASAHRLIGRARDGPDIDLVVITQDLLHAAIHIGRLEHPFDRYRRRARRRPPSRFVIRPRSATGHHDANWNHEHSEQQPGRQNTSLSTHGSQTRMLGHSCQPESPIEHATLPPGYRRHHRFTSQVTTVRPSG